MGKPRRKSFHSKSTNTSPIPGASLVDEPKHLNILQETAHTVAENFVSPWLRGEKTAWVQKNVKKKVLRIFKKNHPADDNVKETHLEHLGSTIQDHVREAGEMYSMARELTIERGFLQKLPEKSLKDYVALYQGSKAATKALYIDLDKWIKDLLPVLRIFQKNTPAKGSNPSRAELSLFYDSRREVYNSLLNLIERLCYEPLEKNIAPVLPGVLSYKFGKFLAKHRVFDLVWWKIDTDNRSLYGFESALRWLFAEWYAKTFFNENPIKTLYFQEVHLSTEDHNALDAFHETDLLYRVTTSTWADMIWGIDVKNRGQRARWRVEEWHVDAIRSKLKSQSEQSLSRLPLYSLCFGVGLWNNFQDMVWTPEKLSASYWDLAKDLHKRRSRYETNFQWGQ